MQQALVKQFAEILEFVLKFDEHKMKTPAIQNDFSYYRRTLTRASLVRQDNGETDVVVSNEMANRMSLFYAHATPMLRALSCATTNFLAEVSVICCLCYWVNCETFSSLIKGNSSLTHLNQRAFGPEMPLHYRKCNPLIKCNIC